MPKKKVEKKTEKVVKKLVPKTKVVKKVEVVKEVEVDPRLKVEEKGVCFDEEGEPTKFVEGKVSANGKSITTLDGVTYSLE
jgi:hypothetical protein